ncbi:YbfB/YjiJ family MFS transporter [Phytoactinopolyspora endophytica]|uniref:YbfB/YjiJ family MFS transporter n=1 Tax=Phytoactinopolyspora endophytica TaxID=1642495 RepID=UPI001F0F46A2|nr:YbfB/YjiJ family MFS transporter [Phytoactinopolyspora endophytica]
MPVTATTSLAAPPPESQSATRRLGMAGLSAVGVSFGFARYGYGLFLPDIRAEFDLPMSAVGLIGSATYVGYLGALVLVGFFAVRVGPRALVTVGGLSATVGMALVAVANGWPVLVAGLILAGTSPGWIWAPFSDAADRMVPAGQRERVLALIPSGTAFGVVVAGPMALVMHGSNWNYAWLVFAAAALAATLYNIRVLPAGPPSPKARRRRDERLGVRWFVRGSAVPLYLTALSYGVVGSVYWLLAVEAISSAGGGGDADGTAAAFWTVMGAAGTLGVFTGVVFTRLGLRRSHLLLFGLLAVASALLGAAPGSLVAVGLSAVLYGPSFMAGSALLAVWSYQIFPERPTTGFSATVFFLGIGTITGPAAAGALADHHGVGWAFLFAAAVALATGLLRPPALPTER